MYDYHAHSNYSDGTFMHRMIKAAMEAGLDGIGFSDHCNVSERQEMIEERNQNAFNLDLTLDRRRSAIGELRERYPIRIFEAVEMDFHMDDEEAIAAFLDEAGFEYVIGSVHRVDNRHVQDQTLFQGMDEAEREAVVAKYMDNMVAMIESGLVDIVAHIDVFERNPLLRDKATRSQYERVAEALAGADAIPEINAGRVLRSYGRPHPRMEFLEVLREHDVRFTLGTDSHRPDEVVERNVWLRDFMEETGLRPVEPFS